MRRSMLNDEQAQFLREEKEVLSEIRLALAELDVPREALATLQEAILQLDELFLLVVVGVLLLLGERLPIRIGRLPGDIVIRGRNTTLYFPLVTSLVLSGLVICLAWMWLQLAKREVSLPIWSTLDVPELAEDDSPYVSIIATMRGDEQGLERCVQSLLRQDYPRYEVIMMAAHCSAIWCAATSLAPSRPRAGTPPRATPRRASAVIS